MPPAGSLYTAPRHERCPAARKMGAGEYGEAERGRIFCFAYIFAGGLLAFMGTFILYFIHSNATIEVFKGYIL